MVQRQLDLFSQARRLKRLQDNRESAGRISCHLSGRCGRRVEVIFTDNTSTMIAVKRSANYRIRLHHMFADAPEEVLNALAVYIK